MMSQPETSASYDIRIDGDPDRLVQRDIVDVITSHYAVSASPNDRPGHYLSGDYQDPGVWVLRVRGSSTFLVNLGLVIAQLKAQRAPGPGRDCLEALYEAIEEALPA